MKVFDYRKITYNTSFKVFNRIKRLFRGKRNETNTK